MRVACVIGTRPEAIKMAPVVRALRRRTDAFSARLVSTGQHRDLLHAALEPFGLEPDVDLDLMSADQQPAQVVGRVVEALGRRFAADPPDFVLAQGDTATVLGAAMASFLSTIPFGHVEAGLRTGDLRAPFPEEYNRRVATLSASLHFAPTARAKDALLAEGVDPARIHVTGNTVVDALALVLGETSAEPGPFEAGRPYVLMTCHRRESFGAPIRAILGAVRDFATAHPEVGVWYPVHPNPKVRNPAETFLGGLSNVHLSAPLSYPRFVHAMKGAALLLTDSGGVQEEAATLGVPAVVVRERTERPEAVEAGACRLVGTDGAAIGSALEDGLKAARGRTEPSGTFGDGRAAERIASALSGWRRESP